MKKIRKTIEIEVNETVDADIALGIDEIVSFISECNDSEKSEIRAALNDKNVMPLVGVRIKTLDDQFKLEAIEKLFHKYSTSYLESLL